MKKVGIVYGAALKNNILQHMRIDSASELYKILKSKYIQSNITDIYSILINDLRSGKKVLFCGTPCQVSAIRKNVSKNWRENLILIDFICHGVPSPGIWKSYIKYLQEKFKSPIEKINFRNKKNGWHDYSFSFKTNKKDIYESHELNAYMRTFLSDKNIRKSCYNCFIKPDNYASDITLGDAWKIEKENIKFADDKGTSVLITRTEKGEKYLNDILEEIYIFKTDYERWTKYNPSISNNTIENDERNTFFDDFKNLSIEKFWKKNERIPLKKVLKYKIKRLLKILKIEKCIRSLRK